MLKLYRQTSLSWMLVHRGGGMPNIDTTAPAMDRPAKIFGVDEDGQLGWMPVEEEELADPYQIAPMGGPGAGLGVCPEEVLPEGMEPLPGNTDRRHQHFGNYQYEDGSIMCWVPKFFTGSTTRITRPMPPTRRTTYTW